MTTEQPTFKRIGIIKSKPRSIDDVLAPMAVVEQFAKETNVPAIVFPADQIADSAKVDAAPAPTTPKARTKKEQGPTPSVRFSVEVPDYLHQELLKRGATQRVTRRYLVLQAFRDAGYVIKDIDMKEDGRRGR